MVKAIRLGVPSSYMMFIANSGDNMPHTYPEWRVHIIQMHEERQRKWAFDQTTGAQRDPHPPLKGHSNTATSTSQKADDMISLLSGKPTSSGPPWEPGIGRWQPIKMITYGGQGEPMDIGKLQAEGRCFRCHKKGHLSKDCPKKWDYKNIHSVVVAEQEKTESKVKEVKDMAV
ncbi:uncharacterized protein ARMOST_04667 [Armillaria ostoyae]|uniref:CCHC-type domain-containing protein n=1 Tax=Armillaria ostoyae TaxID=47428 RepID=A0A284QXY7_ARMOS|nr:uncharacterized protein ARMOST_04667 [Armillaria ostoyae]